MEQPAGYETKEALWRDWEVFKPDLLFPIKNLIIEIDGDFHFNTKKGVRQTNKRNEFYEYAGIKLIWYEAKTLKAMSDAELFLDLVDRL
jgi:very-short-patch-repair endonuclease